MSSSSSVLKYCIGVINKQNGEITYYTKFEITNVFAPVAPSTDFNITIANGTDTATLICTENNHLLNKSPYEMFELDVLPTVTTTVFNPLNDISKFVKNVNDNKFTPFCAPMQLWMNHESILTGDYLPKELILMTGITVEPKPNQKDELMCKMLLDRSVANCGIVVDQNFNSIDTDATKLKKGSGEPKEPAMTVKPGPASTPVSTPPVPVSTPPGPVAAGTKPSVGQKISNFFRSQKVSPTFGGGLKSGKPTLATQSVMQRIYRQVQQRRTDYYNYA
jgi:hypothetical protein